VVSRSFSQPNFRHFMFTICAECFIKTVQSLINSDIPGAIFSVSFLSPPHFSLSYGVSLNLF
jgi:hypothetical protein